MCQNDSQSFKWKQKGASETLLILFSFNILPISETTNKHEPQRHIFTVEGVTLLAAKPGWGFVSDNSG